MGTQDLLTPFMEEEIEAGSRNQPATSSGGEPGLLTLFLSSCLAY